MSSLRAITTLTCLNKQHNTHPHTMIQRTLLRVSRASSSSFASIPKSATSLSRPQFRPQIAARISASRQLSARWYSSEPEAKKEGEEKVAEAQAEDPAKKELEAKNREIIELKVRVPRFCLLFRGNRLHTLCAYAACKERGSSLPIPAMKHS